MFRNLFAVFLATTSSGVFADDLEMVSLVDGTESPPYYFSGGDLPAITPDGRYIAFIGQTSGNPSLVSGVNDYKQVFLRDRQTDTTHLISRNAAGEGASSNVEGPLSISDDGCRVVFNSYASNLVANDNNGRSNVFVHDRCVNPPTTQMVDVLPNGTPSVGEGGQGHISGDGRKVAFFSYQTDLVPGLKNKINADCSLGLYIRNLDTNSTTAPTYNGACVVAAGPALSHDGSRVAFYNWGAYDLPSPNGMWQVWVYDATNGSFKIASASASGAAQRQYYAQGCQGEGATTATLPTISPDGRYVAIRSRGAGLTHHNTCSGVSQLYVKDIDTGAIVMASVDSQDQPGNGDSTGSSQGYRPSLSWNGRYLAFHTFATNIVPGEPGSDGNIAVRDMWAASTVGVGIPGSNGIDSLPASLPAISASGRHVVFYSNSDSVLDPRWPGEWGYFMLDRGVPMPPTLTSLENRGSSIRLHFTAPFDPGTSPITGYQARCQGKNGALGIANGLASPLTVTGLKGGLSYWCSVSATNNNGGSAPSNTLVRKGASIAPLLGILLD